MWSDYYLLIGYLLILVERDEVGLFAARKERRLGRKQGLFVPTKYTKEEKCNNNSEHSNKYMIYGRATILPNSYNLVCAVWF